MPFSFGNLIQNQVAPSGIQLNRRDDSLITIKLTDSKVNGDFEYNLFQLGVKPIPFLNNFLASKSGQIFWHDTEHNTLIKQHNYLTQKGYLSVCFFDHYNRKQIRSVHRLVANAFIPNPEAKSTVNHIDHNKLNNSIYNLEWVTKEENLCAALFFYSLKRNPNAFRKTFENILDEMELVAD